MLPATRGTERGRQLVPAASDRIAFANHSQLFSGSIDPSRVTCGQLAIPRTRTMDDKLHDEHARVAALHRYQIADTGEEEQFSQITNVVRTALGVPMAAVLLVGAERISYKAASGLDGSGSPRRDSFCNLTIKGRGHLLVSDAASDVRFASNPYVVGAPFVRAYLGVPLRLRRLQHRHNLCDRHCISTVHRGPDQAYGTSQ